MTKSTFNEEQADKNFRVSKNSHFRKSKSSKRRLLIMGSSAIILLIAFVVISGLVRKSNALNKWCSTTKDGEMSMTESTKGRAKCGQLIFDEEFTTLNLDTWEHELTMSGGGNGEFQIYQNNRSNSYVQYSKLYIKPTLTSDKYGSDFLYKGSIDIGGSGPADQCTNPLWNGCSKTGTQTHPLNPVMSARIRTVNSFAFKYGTVEVKAKLPSGDWLWPAIWLMPQNNHYGGWPASGEIDILESRGNQKLYDKEGKNIGVQKVASTLHFGPYPGQNGWEKAHFSSTRKENDGFNVDFHVYKLDWTPDEIKFSIDGTTIGTVDPKVSMWDLGDFRGVDNPWIYSNTMKIAPFDQKFYIVINLAVGGTNGYFPDGTWNQPKKPWTNDSPTAFLEFLKAQKDWYSTWSDEDSALQVDYIRVWAL